MLNYTDNHFREFVKDIKIGEAGQDESQVLRVLEVTKQNNNISSKEIWPGPATLLALSTNYDNYDSHKQPDDGAYDIPIINTKSPKYVPLQITVTPYPAAAAWRLECSPNMTLPASASRVFYGKQTVTIQQTAPTDTEQIRWIQAVPAVAGSIIDPPRFRFFMSPVDATEGEEEETGDDAAYIWSFDDKNNLLNDSVHGVSLASHRNTSSPLSHYDEDNAPSGGCLKGVYATSSNTYYIKVEDALYARNTSFDTATLCCWYDENTELSVFTEAATPEVGATVFTEEGVDTGKTVEDYFLPNTNYFHADLDSPDPLTDVSLCFAIRPDWWMEISLGGMRLELSDGNRFTLRGKQNDSWIGQRELGSGIWEGGIQRIAKNWCHVAIISKGLVGPLTTPYTPEKGYGYEVITTAYAWCKKEGETTTKAYYGFVRDPLRDEEGKYAWTLDRTLDPEMAANCPVETMWTTVEEFNLGSWPGVSKYTLSGETGITGNVAISSGILKYRFRHDTMNIAQSSGYVAGSYLPDWTIRRSDQDPGSVGLVYVYHNGTFKGFKLVGRGAMVVDPSFIEFTIWPSKAGSAGAMFDDIRIYHREVTAEEVEAMASLIGDTSSAGTDTSKPSIGLPDILHYSDVQQNAIVKLTIGDSDYMYDPLSTVFNPTQENKKAARFGWERISGTGPDHVWSDELQPNKNTKCYAQALDDTVDDNLVISNKAVADLATIPLTSHMTSYVIDEQTVAVVCDTHDFIQKMARVMYPDIEAIHYQNYCGHYGSGQEYKAAGSQNGCIIYADRKFQPQFRSKMDDVNNFAVDGQPVTLVGRWWESIGLFHWNPIQFRNCKPGDTWYVPPEKKNMWVHYCWNDVGDYAHVAYLRLSSPMAEGSTHTITWLGNSCTVKYGKEQYTATIKVNQEGYRAWGTRRYAYLGQWLGTGEAYDPTTVIGDNKTFYIVPADDDATVEDAVYEGTMIQRCNFHDDAGKGTCSDVYTGSGKPLDGENTYELSFGNIPSCVKDAIVVNSVTYFRDKVADWVDGSITVDSHVYTRKPEKDACCAWAWYNANAVPTIVYTDTNFPTTNDKARIGYDDSSTEYVITNVTQTPRYGWTTERITEESYGTATTIWTTTSNPAANAVVTFEDGTTGTVTEKLTDQTTADISGDYRVYVPHIGYSHIFNIGNQGVGHMFYVHSRGMFHQRSGCAHVNHPYTNFEYDWAGHAPIFLGDTWREPSDARNAEYVWKVDPVTHEPILSDEGAKQAVKTAGSMFEECSALENYSKHYPLYGVHGGWFDAADFDMRDYHLECIEVLAAAYAYFPQNFTDNQLQLPESGDGIPDILSEALWGAELYRRAQFEDGSVSTWFETSSHEKDWPWLSRKRYYRNVGDLYGTIEYVKRVGILVTALRIAEERATTPEGKKNCRAYADMYTESLLHAWAFIEREFDAPYQMKPDERRTRRFTVYKDETYEYAQPLTLGDTSKANWSDLYLFGAAAEMYRITHQARFKEWLSAKRVNGIYSRLKDNDNNWHFAIFWSLLKGIDDLPETSAAVRRIAVEQANRWMNLQEQNTYRIIFWAPGNTWFKATGFGCIHPEQRGSNILAAYLATNDKKYLEALAVGMDHVTGCCSNGRTWTTGMGKVYPVRHLDSWLPRACVQRDAWTGRPGITLYTIHQPGIKWEASCIGVCHVTNGRWDMNIDAGEIMLYPAEASRKWNVSSANWSSVGIEQHMPFWRTHQCFECEDINVGSSEYTVWETMVWKMAIAGILMGPGWKPKFWYNQVKPAKKIYEEKNYVMLP